MYNSKLRLLWISIIKLFFIQIIVVLNYYTEFRTNKQEKNCFYASKIIISHSVSTILRNPREVGGMFVVGNAIMVTGEVK